MFSTPGTICRTADEAVLILIFPVERGVNKSTKPTASNGLDVRSSIRLDQIRTVDRQRLVRRLGVVDADTMTKVDEAIKISLGLLTV